MMDFDPSTAKALDAGEFDPQTAAPVRPTPTQTPAPTLKRSAGEIVKDTGVGLVQGTGYLLGGMAELGNLATGGLADKAVRKAQGLADRALGGTGEDGSGITGAYTGLNTQLNKAKSPTLQKKQADLAQTEGFVASAKKVLTDPTLAGQFAAEQVPNLLMLGAGAAPTLARGVAAAEARGLTGKAAQDAGRKFLERQIVASEAAQEAGPSAQQAKQQIQALPQAVWDANPEYAQRVAAGEAPDAVKTSMENWAAAKAAGVGGIAGAIGGKITAPLEGRIFTRGADLSGDSLLRSTAKAVGKEAAEETIQEGGNQFGSNVGVHSIDPTQSLTEGVAENAGIGAALGGLIGGGINVAGAATARAPQEQPGAEPTLTQPAPGAEANLRAAVDAAQTPEARAQAEGALADYMQGSGRMLEPPAPITVDSAGVATTPRQAARLDSARTNAGLSPDVRAAQLRHPGFTSAPVPFPDAAPGSLSDVVNTVAVGQQPALQVPPNVDPTTGESAPWSREQIKAYLSAQLEVGKPINLPKGATIAQAFGIKPREAAEIRREVVIAAKTGTTPLSQDTTDADAAGRSAPAGNPDAAGATVGTGGLAGENALAPGPVAGSLADAVATTHAVAPPAAAESDEGGDRGAPAAPEVAGAAEAVAPEVSGPQPSATPPAVPESTATLNTAAAPVASAAASPAETEAPQTTPVAGETRSAMEGVASATPVAGIPASPESRVGEQAPAPGSHRAGNSPADQSTAPLQSAPRGDSSLPPPAGEVAPLQAENQASRPSQEDTPAAPDLHAAAHAAATSPKNDLPAPTEAQIEAGNYTKGHHRVAGLDVSIENPAGSRRRAEWPPLKDHYGYIRGSVGADKDHVDVFLTKHAEDTTRPVFVVDQVNKDGSFDEHKVVMGAADEAEARTAYLRNYQKGWTGLGGITQMSQDEFKAWVKDPAQTKRPMTRLPESTASKQKRIQAAFAENRQAITDSGLKKGDTVTWTENGKTATGTILNLGDKEQAVVAVGRPGRDGGVRDSHVGAAALTKIQPDSPAGPNQVQDAFSAAVSVDHLTGDELDQVGEILDRGSAARGERASRKPDKARLIPTRRADGSVEMRVEPVQPEVGDPADEAAGADALHTALANVGTWVAAELKADREISAKALFDRTNTEVGGTQAQGAYTPRDAYDALELGINLALKDGTFGMLDPSGIRGAQDTMAKMGKLLNRIPTQSKRTKEQDEFQQFSTPPTLAFLAARAANLSRGDMVLEPSAGTGDLVVMAQAAGAEVVANELAPRRAALLRALGVKQVFTENAEQLDNILPDEIRPSVVLMNPPFSASAGRMGPGFRKTAIGAQHVEQALKRLAPGGRLVAIVGEGMAADRPAFRDWWAKIGKEYAVRANIGLSGKAYAKYGTTFDNQLLVIDKTGPTTGEIQTGKFDSAEAALATIEAIRNDAPDRAVPGQGEVAQPATAERARTTDADEDGGDPGRQQPVSPAARGARTGKRAGRQLPEPAADAGRAASNGDDGSGTSVPQADEQRDGRQPDAAVRGGEGAGEGAAIPAGDAGGVAVEASAGSARATGKITNSVFEHYAPQRLKIAGSKPHPGALVQSAAMSAVEPPAPTYTPNLPKAVVTEGKLSLAQLEAVVYAGQAHEQILPNGERRGFFIGDGTGVGKGREISGILLDNIRQGRKRAVWISEKPGLLTDAKRDFAGVGGDVGLLSSQSKIKKDAAIDIDHGVLFTTYATLRQGSSVEGKAVKKAGASRVDQLASWLGPDFDGVVVFDEAHNAGNAVSMKGKRGKTKPSAQALAVIDLQKKLPQARFVYVSATGATEVANLSYATRLGLWGEGTAFPSVESFINAIHEGGLAAMELVSRDMKALGVYTARSLSFDGVTYARLEHPLTDFQREVYDELAKAWQGVLRNIDEALALTSADQNANAKAAAKAQFWGAQQRFFNQVLTAMQTPSVLTQIEADLAAGEAVVLQIVNTYEAAQTRALAEVENEDDLEALDITPRDGLIQYVRNSFPVAEYEEYRDEEGNKRSRPVQDSAGNPVLNKEAVRMRDGLVETLEQIRVPESPLDMIINHFGPDRVAEVTGRKRRVVRRPDPKTGVEKTVVQNRGSTAPAAEAAEFQAGKRDILIFSDAGGTGFSFHADRTAKNQKRRQHYLMQAGWRADKAVQGFGRTHRTNESSQPNYRLVTTDLPAQKRFLSSIARRLDQLGALTKGQRDTANQGLFSAKDNLESQYAQDAVTDFLQSLYRGRIDGMTFNEVARELGFDNLIDKESGGLNVSKLPDVPQFLNRMLSLTVDRQGAVFDQFIQRLEARVDAAIADGTLDTGMQTIEAEKVTKVDEHLLYTDQRSGSQTKAVTLELQHKVKLQRFPDRAQRYVRNVNSQKVWAVRDLPDRTNRDGVIQKMVELAGTGSRRIEQAGAINDDKFEAVEKDAAREAWEAENAKRPKFETERRMVLTGSLLPIWDRIKGDVKVVRAQTDDGERLIGRLIARDAEADTLESFGVGVEAKSVDEIMEAVMKRGETAQLANGWKLKRVRVSNEPRLEVVTQQAYLPNVQSEITRLGGFVERIQWAQRLFMPTGDTDALARLLEARPFKSMVGDEEEGNAIRLSRPDRAAGAGMPLPVLGNNVARWTGRWDATAPRVVPVASAQNLPERARQADGWQTAEGYFDETTGTVYLVAANLRDAARAQKVLAHEAFGHYGIEAITGPALWAELSTTIRRMREGGKHADLFAEIGRRYRGANSEIYTREAIAVMAEKGIRNSVIDRVVAAVRRFLRDVLHLDVRFSEAELRQHLVAAARYVRNGARPRNAPVAAEAPAFSQPDRDLTKQIPVMHMLDGVFGNVERDLKGVRGRAQLYLTRMRDAGRALSNDETGWKISLSGAGIRELTNFDVGKLNMLLALPRITKVATLGGTTQADPAERSTKAYHALYAPVLIGSELRVARLVVREDVNGKFAYDFQRSDVLEQQSPAEAGPAGGVTAGIPAPKAGAKQARPTALTVAQIRDMVNAVDRPGWAMSRQAGAFYSGLLEAVERGHGAPKKADAAAWRGWLDGAQRRGEIKQAERDWLGVDDWLAQQDGAVTRDALREFVVANQVQVQDAILGQAGGRGEIEAAFAAAGYRIEMDGPDAFDMGAAYYSHADEELEFDELPAALQQVINDNSDGGGGVAGETRYGKYTTPGGRNYRELLLTLPSDTPDRGSAPEYYAATTNDFRSSHFDQPNILAHVRFNERTDADGKRVLFIEEIQSDWAQGIRRHGLHKIYTAQDVALELYGRNYADMDSTDRSAVDAEVWGRNEGTGGAAPATSGSNLPNMPFKATDEWAMLAFKRMVRWGADHGFDRIAWTTGEQQADRYSLAKAVSAIEAVRQADGTYNLYMFRDAQGGATGDRQGLSARELEDNVGKELAEKIAAQKDKSVRYSGVDLKVGGEGMRAFYDKILPAAVNKWAKRFGAKVGQTSLPVAGTFNLDLDSEETSQDATLQHSLDLTPAMREAAQQGQPLFSRPDPGQAHIAGRVGNFMDKVGTGNRNPLPGRFDEAQRVAAEKFETFKRGDSLAMRASTIKANAAKRFTQKVIDQFRPLKALNMEAFMQAHLSKGADGALEAAFDHGIPELHQGAFTVKERTGGFRKVMSDLGGEHDQFLMWVVGNRAEALSLEGREHLFTDDDIIAMKRLNQGVMADGRNRRDAYSRAVSELNRYNKAFLDIAEAAGLLDKEGRAVWEDGFYIPFYRAMDEDPSAGPGQVKGLLRQRVIERLIGSKEPLGDPLENILANWSQMLTASMRNMAANKALDSAVEMKIANSAAGPAKGTVWTMREGTEAYWYVHDPFVLESLESLSFNGYDNPLMRAAGRFKRMLTVGVTVNPSFRIRNMARDVISAMATSDVAYNPLRNIVEGLRATAPGSDTNIDLMAGGGAVRFGSINDGDQASHAKRLISMGVQDNQILDSQDKVKNAMRRFYDWWQEVGDRTESINRAVIYRRAIAAGRTHLQASFEARDLMNFTSMGSASAIRALSQVLPFFNARLQGADRLIRGAKADPRRFTAVAGTIAMASALLFLINKDDDDYKNLPDYVRDNYWTVKLAGKWLYIPKPFEVGAMGSIVERGTELAVSGDDYQAKDFAMTLMSLLSSQLAMNPVPQIARPVTEAAFNFDMFRMAPIDSMGQEALLPEDRFTARTSGGAIVAGKVAGISPQRLEHLVTGYFGWLGVQALNASDYLLRDAVNLPSNPRRDLTKPSNLFVLGDFLKEPNPGSSKYVSRFYDAQNEIDELYASANHARKTGDLGRSTELRADPRLRLRGLYSNGDREISRINRQIKLVSNSRALSAAAKNERIDSLNRRRAVIAARVDRIARTIGG